jgi:hypothetical protein
MANHCAIAILVTPSPLGPFTAAELQALVAAIPLDTQTLAFLQVTLGSDATIINGNGQVERDIVVNFTPGFKEMFPDASDQRRPFYNFMRGNISVGVKTPALAPPPLLS